MRVPLTSSSRMFIVLKGCGLCKSQLGLIRTAKTIFAGMKRLANQMETTRYRSKRATTKTLLVSTIFTFTIFKMMVLVWVSVQRLQKLSSEMPRRRHKQGSRMSILVLEPIRYRWIKRLRDVGLRISVSQPGLKRTKKIFSGIQQHLLECIQKCRSLQQITSTNQATIPLTSMWIMSMVALKALTLVKQPFIPVRQ